MFNYWQFYNRIVPIADRSVVGSAGGEVPGGRSRLSLVGRVLQAAHRQEQETLLLDPMRQVQDILPPWP